MATKKIHVVPTDPVAILARLIQESKAMSPTAARYFLKVRFSAADKTRMHDLAVRNQEGGLSQKERDELFSYVKAGHLLGILKSKARKSLGKQKARGVHA